MASNRAWKRIFQHLKIHQHDFSQAPFALTSDDIKGATAGFTKTRHREARILCSQTRREDVPEVMQERGLFVLPTKNGHYALVTGEGYVDVPPPPMEVSDYTSKLGWHPESFQIGDSEMQHVDYAYTMSLIRTFTDDNSLHLTMRGRKYTPSFSFSVGDHKLDVEGVQFEVDAGYEGETQIVLLEAKNSKTHNTIIRQLYYPYRAWRTHLPHKRIRTLFFERREDIYILWEFEFTDEFDYNSIRFVKSAGYRMKRTQFAGAAAPIVRS